MKLLAVAIVSVAMLFHGLSWAQTQTTPNLITPSGTAWGIPGNQILNNSGIVSVEGGGPTTGTAYYNSDTNTIRFSYSPSTVAQTIAINQALSGTGIQINGFNWYYLWMNGGYSSGTLTGSISMTNSQGGVVEYRSFNHPVQPTDTWNVESGTQTFTNPYSLANVGNLTMTFSGQDDRFWMGLYGPRVRTPNLSLNYSVDICAANPLSSPDCPGYTQAQCNISPLYSPACPGYAQAYFTQQCSANPLYDPACPGYQQAYFDYQCSMNALYDTACPGYAQAYFNQQCSLNGLYDQTCPNYGSAYATRQLLNQTSSSTTTTSTTFTTSAASTDPIVIAQSAPTTSTTSPTSVTSVTSVIIAPVPAAPSTVTTIAPTAPAPSTESRRTDAEVKSVTAGPGGAQRAAARAREAAQKNSEAKTMEQQAAGQGLQVGLMGFVPGFDAYASARITDVLGQQVQRQYTQPPVDNRSLQRQLSVGSDRLHQRMVEDQYRR